jgi:hypothetical protein
MLGLVFPLALLALAQDPPPAPQGPVQGPEPPPASAEPAGTPAPSPGADPHEWQDLDEFVHIVNEDGLTLRKLEREMYRRSHARPFHTQAEAQEEERRLRTESVKSALQVQAGQDMGLDPAQVDRQVKDWINRMMEKKGPVEFAEALKEDGLTLYEFQDQKKDQLLAMFWDNYITGNGSVGVARQSRDVYVRPGSLQYAFRECIKHQELLPLIGGHAQSVVLQLLQIDPQSAGGMDASRALAEDVRQRILDGEDMGALVEQYDATQVSRQRRGITEPLREASLMQAQPDVGAFVAKAKPGDVSEVLEYKSKGKSYWRIVRLVDRNAAVFPDLGSLEVQQKLDKQVRKDLADWRREQALKGLYRSSYIWPPEFAEH